MTVKTKYSGPIEVAGVSSEARPAACRADVLNEAFSPYHVKRAGDRPGAFAGMSTKREAIELAKYGAKHSGGFWEVWAEAGPVACFPAAVPIGYHDGRVFRSAVWL